MVRSVKYPATRKNIPSAGLEAHGMVRDEASLRYEYNAHLPPVLRSAPDGSADRVVKLLAFARQRALTDEEATARRGHPAAAAVVGVEWEAGEAVV